MKPRSKIISNLADMFLGLSPFSKISDEIYPTLHPIWLSLLKIKIS